MEVTTYHVHPTIHNIVYYIQLHQKLSLNDCPYIDCQMRYLPPHYLPPQKAPSTCAKASSISLTTPHVESMLLWAIPGLLQLMEWFRKINLTPTFNGISSSLKDFPQKHLQTNSWFSIALESIDHLESFQASCLYTIHSQQCKGHAVTLAFCQGPALCNHSLQILGWNKWDKYNKETGGCKTTHVEKT